MSTEQPPARIRRGPREIAARRLPIRPAASATADSVVVLEDGPVMALCLVDASAGRLARSDRAALAAGRALAGEQGLVMAIAIAPTGTRDLHGLGSAGADRTMIVPGNLADISDPVYIAAALEAGLAASGASHLIVADDGPSGEAARIVAAVVGDHAATNVVRIEQATLVCHPEREQAEVLRPPSRVVLVDPRRFPSGPAAAREARPVAAPPLERPRAIGTWEALPFDATDMPLAEADLILSGGAGLQDWTGLRRAARILGAAVGGSRVACDAGKLPRDRQVGISGTVASPRCYIACGISGAAQHLDGIVGAQRVIAINTDKRAEIMRRADVAVVGEADAIIAAMTRLLEASDP